MNNTNKQTGKAGWCRVRMCFSVCLCKPVWATELERGWSGWTCSICFGARKHTQNRTQPIPPSHTLAHLLFLSLSSLWVRCTCLKLNYTWQLSPNNLLGGVFFPLSLSVHFPLSTAHWVFLSSVFKLFSGFCLINFFTWMFVHLWRSSCRDFSG